MAYYDGLLKLCGFEGGEIAHERPRIEQAFHKLELDAADMTRAEDWTTMHHEVSLLGVRKILRLWLRELVDLVLSREDGKKIVYYGFPTIAGPAQAIAATSDDIYCTCPDVVLCYSLGQIFNKLGPILEAGEANGLPPGHGLCTLQAIRVGALAKGMIPIPHLVLTSSYFCDMGSKTDELLHERYHHPAVYIDGSMDSRWGEFPAYLPERVEFLGGELENALSKVGEVVGIPVTDRARQEGASRSRDLMGAVHTLVEIMKDARPQPVSIVTAEIARRLTTGSASKRILTEGPGALAILIEEVKERVSKGIGVVETDAPRVVIFLGSFSDPSIMRMVEGCGLSIPVTLAAFSLGQARRDTRTITGEELARGEMERGTFHSTTGVSSWVAAAAQHFKLDGVLWNYLYHCRPSAQTSHLLKRYVEDRTGIPVLSLEMDPYDSRTYSAGALRTRVETFAEMLRGRKAMAAA